jgi:hypothetical protein
MLNQLSQSTNQFANLTEAELREAFLAASNGPRENGNHFFNRFKYKTDLFDGDYAAALNQGLDLLIKCHAIDEEAYARIHKGSAYYWIGIAAFMVHDHELATFFFDASVSEDLRAGADPISNPSPSFYFLLVEGQQPAQAAKALVQVLQARIEELIGDYNARSGLQAGSAAFSISDLRARFLRPSISPNHETWRSSATTLISFCMEWDYRNSLLDIRPVRGTAEPFFLHLFKGCVLFESLLKGNPVNPPPLISPLGNTLQHLYNDLGIPANISIGNTDFPSILADLVGADDSIQNAIKFTGRIRNTLGHNLGWNVTLDKAQYHRLFRMVSSSCFHAIACLYPNP